MPIILDLRGFIVSISFYRGFYQDLYTGILDYTVHASAIWYSNITILMFAREDWCEGDGKDGKSVTSCK